MFSRFFIERPIFAAVVALIICLAGLVSMSLLPVAQYPTHHAGAGHGVGDLSRRRLHDARADSVASPIEQQINGVDNMLYMSSISSSTGQLTMTVYFSLDTDPDIAQVQVQNRVNLAMPQLPSAVVQQGVNVQKKSSSIMMLVGGVREGQAATAPNYIANYANVYVLDALEARQRRRAGADHGRAEPGDADLDESGPDGVARHHDLRHRQRDQPAEPALRRRADRPAAQRGPGRAHVPGHHPAAVHRAQAVREHHPARDRRTAARSCASGDVARAEIGLQQYIVDSKLNGVPATIIAVYQQPGANGLIVSDAVREDDGADEGRASRTGWTTSIALDTNDFVRLSIKEVIKTLFEAIVLVVLVVYLFLQSFRTTIICSVAIVVALIATFTGHARARLLDQPPHPVRTGAGDRHGRRRRDRRRARTSSATCTQHHLAPKEATIRSMGEIASSLVAVVLVMCSVFIPAAFLPGHDRPALQAVRDHDRDLGVGVGLHRADADAGDVRGAAQAQSAADARVRSRGSTARSIA